MNPSLAKKVGVWVAAAVGLLILVSWISYQSLADSRDAAHRVRDTQEVQAKLGSMLANCCWPRAKAALSF
jgi:CHASE3 domain sensor protein